MTEQLVTFETAILAKQKGFDELCRNAFVDTEAGRLHPLLDLRPISNSICDNAAVVTLPTQDLLERWLREVHGLRMVIEFYNNMQFGALVSENDHHSYSYANINIKGFDTHELAREAALQHALNLLPDA